MNTDSDRSHSNWRTPDQQKKLEQQLRLHRVCWDFEAQLRDGREPRIEDWLESHPVLTSERGLFDELIGIELDWKADQFVHGAKELVDKKLGDDDLEAVDPDTVDLDTVDPDTVDLGDDLTVSIHDDLLNQYVARFPSHLNLIRRLWNESIDRSYQQVAPEPLKLNHDRYDFIEEIDRGGSGAVWRVYDRQLHRESAIKFLHDRNPHATAIARLEREARLCGRLQHPGIVPVYDLGRFQDGRPMIAMKLIKGSSLAKILVDNTGPATNKKSQFDELLLVFERICDATAYAHQQGIIHRDLKPQNVMVGDFGEVQVMDWGLGKDLANEPEKSSAKNSDASNGSALSDDIAFPYSSRMLTEEPTQIGSVMGTPSFMPPEQASGDIDQVGRRSDVFALGGILCAILTGRGPFEPLSEKATTGESRQDRLEVACEKIRQSKARRAIKRLALDCLQTDPEKRPADAGEVLRRYQQSQTKRRRVRRGVLWTTGGFLIFVTAFELLTIDHVTLYPSATTEKLADGDAIVEVSRGLVDDGNFDAAEDLLKRSIAQADSHSIGLELGELQRTRKKFKDSEETLRKTWNTFPKSAWLMRSLAKTLTADQRPIEAIAILEQAITIHPDNEELQSDLELARTQVERTNADE
ncbi:Serine/threonine-protein kinase PknD [Rubripirellula obstinata]|uniref:Serine/threonine-protein kinase PknD n=1 Tax=Rubripirellula obstinata TaxID=406547 RepID=A0A5B1CQV9_9BACT|nr:serine/threonine-protein kinase [Rubripirellula obstinata]KAA1262030.1 Serine/threonine-protein kinase PknD [Rubripirellula obstinata]